MRIAVCCKGIPMDDVLESVEIEENDIYFRDIDFGINEFDAYALEAAIDLKSRYGVEIIAVSLGPLRNQEVLYYAMARGIDKAVRIDGTTSRPELIASGLLGPLKEINPDIIFAGVQSEDWMGGEVGIYLSQALHMSVSYAVTEICELNDHMIRIKKEIGGGRTAEVLLKLPAVLCIQSGINPLHYLSAGKRREARNKQVNRSGSLDREEAKRTISGMMNYEIEEILLPSKTSCAEMITGERPEVVSRILEIIKNAI